MIHPDYFTHMLEQFFEAIQVPEFSRQAWDSDPLIYFGNSSVVRVKKRGPIGDNEIKTINKPRSLIKHQHFILTVSKAD